MTNTTNTEATTGGGTGLPGRSQLTGNLGVGQLTFTILAFNSPLTGVVAFSALIIGYGNGIGAPMAYVAIAVLSALFAVPFLRMCGVSRVTSGFYALVSTGLGQRLGLGAAFVALLCYVTLHISIWSLVGLSIERLVVGTFHGPDIQWWVWGLVCIVGTAIVSYFRVDVSAKVVTILLAIELVLVAIYDGFVVAKGGANGFSAHFLLPKEMLSGSVGLALLFAVLCFMGFEAAVIFRDEVRNPDSSIPRAVWSFLVVICVVYGFSTYVLIQALGEQNAVASTSADPAGAFMGTVQTYVGTFGVDAVTVFFITGQLAAVLSLNNIIARYVFNMAGDGILPRALAVAHPRHGSPHRATIIVSATSALAVVLLAISKAPPETTYAQLGGISCYAYIVLLCLTTIASILYLNKHDSGANLWTRVIAPLLALVGFIGILYFATVNIEVLITLGTSAAIAAIILVYLTLLVGVLYSSYLAVRKPDVFLRIGRH
jgi:amino acid transporter